MFWVQNVISLIVSRESWLVPVNIEWIIVLPVFPLLRVFITGNSFRGLLDWVPIALVLSMVLVNKEIARQRKSVTIKS